ncbi:MAG TPA: NlpC/P60 family protein [Spirillospora sp.]
MAVGVTVTGLALAVPMASPASAKLNPTVLRSLHLDSATLKQVKAYDKYRTRVAEQRRSAKKAVRFARKQIGKPYRWGAEGPDGYDCSGLVMVAWRKAGVHIPRVTHAQYRSVKRKVKLKNLKPGDLVFFRNRNHVGMYVGDGKYLHAPRTGERVRIDKLTKRRKRQFAGAVRPGAPEYRKWSASVKELVEKIDRMTADQRADRKPPDKKRSPEIPPPTDSVPRTETPSSQPPGRTPAQQAAPPGGPAGSPPAGTPGQTPEQPGHSRPEPRPMYRTPPSSDAQPGDTTQPIAAWWHRGNRPMLLPWAMYPGPYYHDIAAASGRVAT